jgi:hypothetical protein
MHTSKFYWHEHQKIKSENGLKIISKSVLFVVNLKKCNSDLRFLLKLGRRAFTQNIWLKTQQEGITKNELKINIAKSCSSLLNIIVTFFSSSFCRLKANLTKFTFDEYTFNS